MGLPTPSSRLANYRLLAPASFVESLQPTFVDNFLKELNYSEYCHVFKEHGYDDLESLDFSGGNEN
jgi:hypothetical protein